MFNLNLSNFHGFFLAFLTGASVGTVALNFSLMATNVTAAVSLKAARKR